MRRYIPEDGTLNDIFSWSSLIYLLVSFGNFCFMQRNSCPVSCTIVCIQIMRNTSRMCQLAMFAITIEKKFVTSKYGRKKYCYISYSLCNGFRNWKSGQGPTQCCTAIDKWMNEWRRMRRKDTDYSLLGWDAVNSGTCSLTFRRKLLPPYSG
jgi:hypothetical protein